MAKIVQNVVDEVLQQQNLEQMILKLQEIKNIDGQLFHSALSQLKMLISNEINISMAKILLLSNLIAKQNVLDPVRFKVPTIFHLVAVTKGYHDACILKEQTRSPFLRNLKKQNTFWGLKDIQNLYTSLTTNTQRPIFKNTQEQFLKKEYVWIYICNNLDMIPPNFDIYQYIFKHMLMLKCQNQQQGKLFTILKNVFFNYQYHYQVVYKNFRFAIQFFRNSYNEKECGFYPQASIHNILKQYKVYQIDNIFSVASLGLSWGTSEIGNCINNCIKLGVTLHTYVIFKAFIELAKRLKKYQELVYSFETNLTKPFIFMKHQQLFVPSLKFLKQFTLGPWPITNFFTTLIPKLIDFTKCLTPSNRKEFLNYVECIIEKYEQITVTQDLKAIIEKQQKQNEYRKLDKEQVRKMILEYDWRAFETDSPKKTQSTSSQTTFRGLVNIGNSCYLNSFLQCLFLTKQLRRQILQTSTKAMESKVLQKLTQLHKNSSNKGNLSITARQHVRPLAQVQRTFSLLLKSKRSVINPTNIKNVSPQQFHNVFQHDSIQFGRSLLQMIFRSTLENIFEGQTITEIECPNCNEKRHNKEQFLDLMLTSEEESESLQKLIHNSMKDEVIEDLRCDKCETVAKESIKRHWIHKFPNYLILTLKRFEYSIKESKNFKKKFKLQFPEQSIKIEKFQYIIYGIIVHRGTSANSGHYFSFCRESFHEEEKKWLCLNDSEVTLMEDFSKVIQFLQVNTEDTPYILFGCEKQFMQKNWKQMEEPIILRAPLQSYIEKDDLEYVNSLSKKRTFDLSGLKFNTGNYQKREDDDDPDQGGNFNFHNNPIV